MRHDINTQEKGAVERREFITMLASPNVTEIHAGSVIAGAGWKITVGHAQHVEPYLGASPSASIPATDRPATPIDQPSVRERIVHEIQNVFEGRVIWGEDLMRLTPADARVSTIESRQG